MSGMRVLGTILCGALVGALLPLPVATTQASASTSPTVDLGGVRERAVPASGSASTGVWIAWTRQGKSSTGTTMRMPPGAGLAVVGDWNGDGVATPGRFDAGVWFLTNAAVGTAAWEQGPSLGASGDIPVVGQFDDDGRADIGVFRDGQWSWSLSGGTPRSPDTFGVAGDVPVVGDWDGDGRDDLGVVRAGTWFLRVPGVTSRPSWVGPQAKVEIVRDAGVAVVTAALGRWDDVPVAGDWDGDGRDEPGVVRDGRVWILPDTIGDVRPPLRRWLALGPGATPLVIDPVRSIEGCPTASLAGERYGRSLARLVDPAQTPTAPRRGISADLGDVVRSSLGFVIRNDRTKRLADRLQRPFYDPLSTERSEEESVRRSANAALAAAVLLTSGRPVTSSGFSRGEILDYARWHLRSIACQHGATSPGGWGNNWQSALWAVTAGQAGWMIWPSLDRTERGLIAAMVASEAEYASARGPRYFRNRLGGEITPGDSKSDEVSWDLTSPALALAMMPEHPSAPQWRDSLITMAIAAFARPQDLHRPTEVNGIRVDIRIPGTNANEDGTVTNHGIVNPDYIQNVSHLWWAASMLRAGGQRVPEALFLNADIVYRALSTVVFPSPPYAAPGGTVYRPDGRIYYPMGISWGSRRPATFVGVDAFASLYAAPDARAAANLRQHVADVQAMQGRFGSGRLYADGSAEDSYRFGREEYALQQLALAWWATAIGGGTRMTIDADAAPNASLGVGTELP